MAGQNAHVHVIDRIQETVNRPALWLDGISEVTYPHAEDAKILHRQQVV